MPPSNPDTANPLAELLKPEDIVLDVDVADRDALLRLVARHFAERYHGLNEDRVYQALAARERLGSTGLGHGVALPHARMEEAREAVGAFLRLRQPIPFGAPDGRPVGLVLALLVPRHATEAHLRLLAAAAEAFASRTACDRLSRCAAAQEARDILAERVSNGA